MDTRIRQFWEAFGRHHAKLPQEAGNLGATYDALLEEVQRIDPGLYLEMCVNADPKEFIITAEGNKELFPLVDTVVEAAPKVDGWIFFALKPRLGFPATGSWEGFEVKIADVAFKPLPLKNDKLGLRLFVKGLKPEHVGDAHNALLRALDHGLGERAFAEQIEGTEVAPTPGWLAAAGLIPLTDLEDFLRRRRS